MDVLFKAYPSFAQCIDPLMDVSFKTYPTFIQFIDLLMDVQGVLFKAYPSYKWCIDPLMAVLFTSYPSFIQCIDPLMDILFKASLEEVDKTECRDIIYSMVKMEANSEPLPVPTMTTVRKGNKR